jgi:hypothetical protein
MRSKIESIILIVKRRIATMDSMVMIRTDQCHILDAILTASAQPMDVMPMA